MGGEGSHKSAHGTCPVETHSVGAPPNTGKHLLWHAFPQVWGILQLRLWPPQRPLHPLPPPATGHTHKTEATDGREQRWDMRDKARTAGQARLPQRPPWTPDWDTHTCTPTPGPAEGPGAGTLRPPEPTSRGASDSPGWRPLWTIGEGNAVTGAGRDHGGCRGPHSPSPTPRPQPGASSHTSKATQPPTPPASPLLPLGVPDVQVPGQPGATVLGPSPHTSRGPQRCGSRC